MKYILQINTDKDSKNIDINNDGYKAFCDASKNSQYVEIKNNIITINKSFFSDKTKVNDCLFIINENRHEKLTTEKIKNNKIVLILESPHKDEYKKDCFEPLYPANGSSGRAINTYLLKILSTKKITDVNQIILCNPVQWQASLYELHKKGLSEEFKKLRDEIWNFLWEESKQDFIKRLKKYNSEITLNACTKDLKKVVRTVLNKNELPGTKFYEISHPASWWRNKRNRELSLCE